MAKTAVSKVTSKGQVTIPEAIRERLDLHRGDHLEWEATDEGTALVRKAGGALADLVGQLGKPPRSMTVEEMDESIRRHVSTKAHARR